MTREGSICSIYLMLRVQFLLGANVYQMLGFDVGCTISVFNMFQAPFRAYKDEL